MSFRFVGSVLAVAVVAIVGCGSHVADVAERVRASASPIQGGALDTTHNFAVGIVGGVSAADQYEWQVLCSGALIAPNLVISARHCVDQVLNEAAIDSGGAAIDCSRTTFGAALFPASTYLVTTDPNIDDTNATWYQVSQIITPTPTSFCGNDLSLLVLNMNVPTSQVPVFATPEIWYPIDSSQYTSSETAIGYGQDGPGDSDAAANSSGLRRILENISIACIPGDGELPCGPVGLSGPVANEFAAGSGPCVGDSGSSAYEQGQLNAGNWLSLGVLSRGGVEGNSCEGSVYTQLYPWQSLILSTARLAAASGGYSLPAWTTSPADAAPPPDTGAPSPDAGDANSSDTLPGQDGGGAEATSLAPIGSRCSFDSDCSSNICVSATGADGFVCSITCAEAASCSDGYDCLKGYCFVGSESEAVSAPNSSGGCAMGPAKSMGSGSEGVAWAGVAAGLACQRRRRARGSSARP